MKLKLVEVARCLNLPESTIERWIRQGRIPIRKKDNICYFRKTMLEKWAASHKLPFLLLTNDEAQPKQIPLEEDLLPVMQRGGVLHGIKGNNKVEVLESAVKRMGHLEDQTKGEFLTKLIEREQLTSTGIGNGVAIPHPRTPLNQIFEASAITTCFLEKAISFDAIDNRPVFVLFIFLSASVKLHLHLLSRLSFCVRDNDFISFLKTMPSEEALMARIAEMETPLRKGSLR